MKAVSGKFLKRFKRLSTLLAVAAVIVLTACGGGGGESTPATTNTDSGTGTGTTTSAVTITGTLSGAASKPSSGKSAQLYAVSSWAGATLQVVDASGTVVGTGTVNADGSYTVSVAPGSNYFIRVQSGNLVLKAFVPSVTANASVPVNTTTTAEVVVLASVLGVANIGDSGVSATTAIASVNITTVVTQIEANAGIPALANLLATEISNNYNANATTPSIGSASTSVTTTVTTIAVSIPQSVAVVVAVPSAPSGVGVTAGDGQISISWTAVTGATSYNAYYRTTAGVSTANGTKVTGATSGGAITGLVNGTTYYFVVTAVNTGGESAVSSEVSATPQVPVAPGTPTGVGVTAGNAQATVSWTAVTGATSYNVYYRTTAGVTIANGTKVTGATSGGAITGLTNGTTYYFVVTAVNAGGESAISSEVSATPMGISDGAENGIGLWTAGSPWGTTNASSHSGTYSFTDSPAGNYANSVNTSLTLATPLDFSTAVNPVLTFWHKYATESCCDFAYVEISTNGGATWTQLARYNGALAAWTQVSINLSAYAGQPSVKVRFRLQTDTSVVYDGWYLDDIIISGSSTTGPSAPTGVGVTAGNAQATVSWTAVTGATSYNVYYRTTAGVTIANGTKVTGATSPYIKTGLTNGTTYYFVATAVNAGGESAVSSEVNAIPQVSVPGAPTGVGVTAGNAQATVSWTAVTGATSYNVYYRTTAGVTKINGTKVTGATSPYIKTGLANGTAYYFVVTAVNAGGESAISSEASATPLSAPSAPTGVGVTAGNAQATVSWTAVTGATSYNVYYRTTAGVTKINGTKVTGATSPYIKTGLTNGTAYYFVVTAVNAGGESAISSEASATPAAGTNISGNALYVPNDPFFANQWHLKNTGQLGATGVAGLAGEDLNLQKVWTSYKGAGQRIAIVDNGLDVVHPDLAGNVVAGASWDYTTNTSANPTVGDYTHGTACGGIVAAVGNNAVGVAGTAMNASLVGYNLLQNGTNANMADAMTRGIANNSIYSNSWGSGSVGFALAGGSLWETAVTTGLATGRGNKGAIYVFSAGNSYPNGRSDYLGLQNFKGVIAVAALSDKGIKSSYSSIGSNVLISSYGGEYCSTHAITTTDITGALGWNLGSTLNSGVADYADSNYTKCMNGTSAAAPEVSGVIALILEANPNLTWRDVRIILATTARKNDPTDTTGWGATVSGWGLNGAGLNINDNYGYGAVDALAAVNAALNWVSVGPSGTLVSAVGSNPITTPLAIADGTGTILGTPGWGAITTSAITITNSGITKIEFVDVSVTSNHTYFGDLLIWVTSPSGTMSMLSTPHACYNSAGTLVACTADLSTGFRFGVARLINESANGTWTLSVRDGYGADTGSLSSWSITAHGH